MDIGALLRSIGVLALSSLLLMLGASSALVCFFTPGCANGAALVQTLALGGAFVGIASGSAMMLAALFW
ncbi:MAG: hypothetical protein ACYDCK_05060 [Thermoplasmatota archaeon]